MVLYWRRWICKWWNLNWPTLLETGQSGACYPHLQSFHKCLPVASFYEWEHHLIIWVRTSLDVTQQKCYLESISSCEATNPLWVGVTCATSSNPLYLQSPSSTCWHIYKCGDCVSAIHTFKRCPQTMALSIVVELAVHGTHLYWSLWGLNILFVCVLWT